MKKQKSNCMTRALDQWAENPVWFWLWYNSNHVISLEIYYHADDLVDHTTPELKYIRLHKYGYDFLVKVFSLTPKYQDILRKYIDHETEIFEGNY